MPAPIDTYGLKLMTATWRTCSPFRVRSQRRSPTSCKQSFRRVNAIELPPTSDISAFDLYVRAKNILLTPGSIEKADTLQAVDLLNQAVARDPSFFRCVLPARLRS
jgi:hypothetical protein